MMALPFNFQKGRDRWRTQPARDFDGESLRHDCCPLYRKPPPPQRTSPSVCVAGTAAVGSYTTFSTWMLKTRLLAEERQRRVAATNIDARMILGLSAALLGQTIVERIQSTAVSTGVRSHPGQSLRRCEQVNDAPIVPVAIAVPR